MATHPLKAALAAAIALVLLMCAAGAAEARRDFGHKACSARSHGSGRATPPRARRAARRSCRHPRGARALAPRKPVASLRVRVHLFPEALTPAQLSGGAPELEHPSGLPTGPLPPESAPDATAPGAPGSAQQPSGSPGGGSSGGVSGEGLGEGGSGGGASGEGEASEGGGSGEGGAPESGGNPEGAGSPQAPSEEPSEGPTSGESTGTGEPATSVAPFRFFSPTSFWNQTLSPSAPLDANSESLVDALDAEVTREEEAASGPWINTKSYSVPIYTVPSSQATLAVKLTTTISAPALQEALQSVPLPADAKPAAGTDGELVVWQPSTDRIWEFWRLAHTTEGWQAAWGGAMQHVTSDSGAFDGSTLWPGATTRWGVSASAMSLVGGLISLEDLQLGVINHALSMSLPAIRSGVYATPAQRCDGRSASTLALPEGAHLRLDPSLDLAALHLPPLTLMIARAAQRYGIYIKDGARNITLDAQDPTPTGTEPYKGATGYFEGLSPRELLAAFPWSHLQVLDMQLHAG